MKNCTRCDGTGFIPEIKYDGGSLPSRPCYSCEGRGEFPPVDVESLLLRIKGRKGLRSTMTSYCPVGEDRVAYSRAYYVWRMARFHGGKDTTMPFMASIMIGGDPYLEELNQLADEVAKAVFGSDMRAAQIWGRALGYDI